MHLRPSGFNNSSRGIRASEPDNLMARPDQLGNDGGTDETGRTGEKNAHQISPPSCCLLGSYVPATSGAPGAPEVANPHLLLTKTEVSFDPPSFHTPYLVFLVEICTPIPL